MGKCVAMFTMAQRREPSQKIRDAIGLKIQELTQRADEIEAARAADILAASAPSAAGIRDAMESTLNAEVEAERAASILAGTADAGVPAAPAPAAGEASSAAAESRTAIPDA